MNPQRIQLRRCIKKCIGALVATTLSPLIGLFFGLACIPGIWSEIFENLSGEWK